MTVSDTRDPDAILSTPRELLSVTSVSYRGTPRPGDEAASRFGHRAISIMVLSRCLTRLNRRPWLLIIDASCHWGRDGAGVRVLACRMSQTWYQLHPGCSS
ncbi:hypothetical protein RRG08_050104 [Elysia crispata]|uniref:Uncharacterized protein n=1 Tax=Elysia crispata TaxID=231223 RepID=A0AAE0Z5Y7_9GAST|nr:hypothetical protein RRG08_050104 [Elysia crispata]